MVCADATSTDEKRLDGEMKVSYPHDSYLAVEYPHRMAVLLETNPYPLLNTRLPLTVRRRILLPDNQTHVAEWRYHVRGHGAVMNSQSRVGVEYKAAGLRMIDENINPRNLLMTVSEKLKVTASSLALMGGDSKHRVPLPAAPMIDIGSDGSTSFIDSFHTGYDGRDLLVRYYFFVKNSN